MPAWIYHGGLFVKVEDGSRLQASGDIVAVLNASGGVIAAFHSSDNAFAVIADKQPTFSKREVKEES